MRVFFGIYFFQIFPEMRFTHPHRAKVMRTRTQIDAASVNGSREILEKTFQIIQKELKTPRWDGRGRKTFCCMFSLPSSRLFAAKWILCTILLAPTPAMFVNSPRSVEEIFPVVWNEPDTQNTRVVPKPGRLSGSRRFLNVCCRCGD